MDSSSKPPRKELQGPRPTPLKVHKDSHKIRKPPPVPPQQQQPRQPVIIYTVSPKVIHVEPSNFMELVQRLTGNPSTSSTSISNSSLNPSNDGQMSPAARYATIEKAARSSPDGKRQVQQVLDQASGVEGVNMDCGVDRSFPGILSSGPAGLPPIPPSFFSPASDPNSVNWFHDFSPGLQGNRNYMEGSVMPSSSVFGSPQVTSPYSSIDLFNNFSGL